MKALKEFLQTIFQTLEYSVLGTYYMILPQDILSLPQEQLIYLIDVGLIKKLTHPNTSWCNNCDVVCEVEFVNNKEFLICLECGSQEKINPTNSLQYSSGLTEISEFLQNILELTSEVETIHDDRVLYLGCKGKEKYYLFCGIHQTDCLEILQKISNAQYAYILVLENNHNLKVPQTIFIYNILDFLSFENTKFVLALPKITYTNSIASSGGIAKSDKYTEVRDFIIKEFDILKEASSKTYLYKIYETIADTLRKQPHLIKALEDSNLEDFIRKTITKYKKSKIKITS